jgi:Protein of unknown function (DUF2452)
MMEMTINTSGINTSGNYLDRNAPKVDVPDLLSFKTKRDGNLSRAILTRLEEIKKEYEKLIELQKWNQYVESFSTSIEIKEGKIYFLYEKGERRFLSILSPEELNGGYKCVGKTRVSSEGYFIKEIY